MVDLYKYVGLDGKLPVVHLTPEEFIDVAWRSVPAVATGIITTALLVFLRGWLVELGRDEKNTRIPGWLKWIFCALHHVGVWYLIVNGVAGAVAAMPVSNEMKHVVAEIYGVLSIVQLGLVLTGVMNDSGKVYLRRGNVDGGRVLLVRTMMTVGTLVIWALMGVMMLNAFGVNVTSLVAGLGLGGIAIAFAAKNIVENVMASFTMVLNPPFVIGDWIETDAVKGQVEEITLKNVLVRGMSGEQWILPSGGLMNSRIRNLSRMRERRVEVKFGVGYATMTPERLENVPKIAKEAVESFGPLVKFDRAHLTGFGDNLITFEVVFHVLSADYKAFMDIRQGALFKMYRRMNESGIVMALGFRAGTAGDYTGITQLLEGEEKPAAKGKKAGK